MDPVVVCPANFSAGQRKDVIEKIARAIEASDGAAVLGWERDLDHNRAVVTFAGAPVAVSEAAYAGIREAADLIDMDHHEGQHPRIGAADVLPFVPYRGVSMADCVALARSLGARVGESLRLPVFLYAEAAVQIQNRRLADIRRGGYEGLKRSIERGTNPLPDFGPRKLGKAGGCSIGARGPLIAFNVYLSTADVMIAKSVARAIRESSGGLPHVQALGFEVRGLAQVSMNLTDFRLTSISDAVSAIRREAAFFNVSIHSAEIIGLLPAEALSRAEASALRVENYSRKRILDLRLAEFLS